jgi:hypothetical protein
MKVKELLEALQNVDGELEVYSGTGDEYVSVVRPEDVNVQETDKGLILLSIQGQGRLVCFYEKKKEEVAAAAEEAAEDEQANASKQLPISVLIPLFRAYLCSLKTRFFYRQNFETLLGEESLGEVGKISDETWKAIIDGVSNEWFVKQEGQAWDFERRMVTGGFRASQEE